MALIRQAETAEIDRLIWIRGAVRENRLSDPASVTRADYAWFVGKGLVWVAEVEGLVAGFSAGDPRDGTIWALFVDPAFEGSGLGARLLDRACADVKAGGFDTVTLSTDPGTKAARLYQRLGWRNEGQLSDGEVRFVLEV